jgi:hypothetical protein
MKKTIFCVGFEVLTAVVTNSTIFWHITPCSPLSVNRRFGGKYRLHLQSRKISQARNQSESPAGLRLALSKGPNKAGDLPPFT